VAPFILPHPVYAPTMAKNSALLTETEYTVQTEREEERIGSEEMKYQADVKCYQ